MASLEFKGKHKTAYIRYRQNGKSFRKNIGKVCKATAVQMLQKFEETLSRHNMGIKAPNRVTLTLFLQDYMEWVQHNQAHNTYLSKCLSQKQLLRYLSTHERGYNKEYFELQELSTVLIERYKRHRQSQHLDAQTINKELNFISHIIATATSWDYVVPDIKIIRLKETKKAPRYFSHDEMHQLNTKSSNYLKQAITIGLNTGMRIGEMLNLQWSHIDLDKNRIHVANTDSFSTKNKKDRFIPINSALYEYLVELKTYYVHPSTDSRLPREKAHMAYVCSTTI